MVFDRVNNLLATKIVDHTFFSCVRARIVTVHNISSALVLFSSFFEDLRIVNVAHAKQSSLYLFY